MKKLFNISIMVFFTFALTQKVTAQNTKSVNFETFKTYELADNKVRRVQIDKVITTESTATVVDESILIPTIIPIDSVVQIMNTATFCQIDKNITPIWPKWYQPFNKGGYAFDRYIWQRGEWHCEIGKTVDQEFNPYFCFYLLFSLLIGIKLSRKEPRKVFGGWPFEFKFLFSSLIPGSGIALLAILDSVHEFPGEIKISLGEYAVHGFMYLLSFIIFMYICRFIIEYVRRKLQRKKMLVAT